MSAMLVYKRHGTRTTRPREGRRFNQRECRGGAPSVAHVCVSVHIRIQDTSITYRQVLEQPRSEDVGGHLWEDTAFLLVLLAIGIVVLLPGTLAAAYASVARVTCNIAS